MKPSRLLLLVQEFAAAFVASLLRSADSSGPTTGHWSVTEFTYSQEFRSHQIYMCLIDDLRCRGCEAQCGESLRDMLHCGPNGADDRCARVTTQSRC